MRDWQKRVRLQPDNEWAVYEACKVMGRSLAELDHAGRLKFLAKMLPWATARALEEGLAEWEATIGERGIIGPGQAV